MISLAKSLSPRGLASVVAVAISPSAALTRVENLLQNRRHCCCCCCCSVVLSVPSDAQQHSLRSSSWSIARASSKSSHQATDIKKLLVLGFRLGYRLKGGR